MKHWDYSDITLIIPTLNEANNISKIIDIIYRLYPQINVIVSDDDSTDGTQNIVRKYSLKNKRIMLLDRSKEAVHGLAASVVHGAKVANSKYLIIMDGDMQHPPEKVEEIADELRNGADIVIGTRKKDLTGWKWHRKLISKTAILLGRIRLMKNMIKCRDILSGFFGIRANLMNEIIARKENKIQMEGYKILFDILKYVPRRTKIREVEYYFGIRKMGQSKLNKKHIYLYIKSVFSH